VARGRKEGREHRADVAVMSCDEDSHVAVNASR
jgi:hypothetical protein